MPPPRRVATRRTAAAIAEDLAVARWTGGIDRADGDALSATIDWLQVVGLTETESPLVRARNLLRHYSTRICEHAATSSDVEAVAAATSLRTLLLRPSADRRNAEVVRREAAEQAGFRASPDAVRHREAPLIETIAADVAADLQSQRVDEPQTVEAALHDLMRLILTRRQYFHNWLCALYPPQPPQDQDEIDKRALFFDTAFAWFCELLSAADHTFELSRRLPDITMYESSFAHFARHIRYKTFPEPDRKLLLPIVRANTYQSAEELIDLIRTSGEGQDLFNRWIDWVQSCTPTCAFERSFDWSYMCHPHIMLTHMYNIEVLYRDAGYETDLGVEVMGRHNSIRPDS